MSSVGTQPARYPHRPGFKPGGKAGFTSAPSDAGAGRLQIDLSAEGGYILKGEIEVSNCNQLERNESSKAAWSAPRRVHTRRGRMSS
ncbi:hypothetical protein AKJ09_05853 [Labilithrix luteola]|uniref:Uncharacterized protein n=1 Tax=Labilithrix luteola TaxID=1391654 RepID=A0A0K1Q1B1_9BACT|nr:hypothetical protein [Labilithrix luteola]AKU99189.1 hypothetical protein AKJ09_05853 [Labilithrix luteola]